MKLPKKNRLNCRSDLDFLYKTKAISFKNLIFLDMAFFEITSLFLIFNNILIKLIFIKNYPNRVISRGT